MQPLRLCVLNHTHMRSHMIGNLLKNQLPSDMTMYPKPPLSLVVFKEEIKEASTSGQAPPTPAKPLQPRKHEPIQAPAAPQVSPGPVSHHLHLCCSATLYHCGQHSRCVHVCGWSNYACPDCWGCVL